MRVESNYQGNYESNIYTMSQNQNIRRNYSQYKILNFNDSK
jgi:hypothetical protein